MEVIGFLPDEISAALELLAAILNIGNAMFEGYSLPNGTDACKMSAESTTCKFQGLNDSPLHMHNTNQKDKRTGSKANLMCMLLVSQGNENLVRVSSSYVLLKAPQQVYYGHKGTVKRIILHKVKLIFASHAHMEYFT